MSLFTEIILDRLIKYFTFSGFIYDFMLTSSAMHCGNLNYCMVANFFEKFEFFSILKRILEADIWVKVLKLGVEAALGGLEQEEWWESV